MKKIYLHRFHGMNNYGSAMMGLVMMNELHKRLNGNVSFYFYNSENENIQLIKNEFPYPIDINEHTPKEIPWSKFRWIRSYQKRKHWFDTSEIEPYDAVIVLGGDDLSEYYTKKIYPDLIKYWAWSKKKPVVLFGQTMGPFKYWKNKWTVKNLYKEIPVFTRDYWTKNYLEKSFGLKRNIHQTADLAFLDLPAQHDRERENRILKKYKLTPGDYFTVVISGLQGKYYTPDRHVYLDNYRLLLQQLTNYDALKDKKIVLLAHTFPPHGDEAAQIRYFLENYGPLPENIVPVTEKTGPANARFILGNGLFTITGRMHAAISTFQMGKPAVSLSYSAKYEGVIGKNLQRSDLIIDANNPELWATKQILALIHQKVQYLLENYKLLNTEIETKISEQKNLLTQNIDKLAMLIDK